MTAAIPPSSSLPITPSATTSAASVVNALAGSSSGAAAPTTPAAGTGNAQPVAAVQAPATAAQVAPIVAAAQAALAQTVNLSPQAQQAIKLEAFHQLVAQLVNHVQPLKVDMPAHWPAGGVTPALQAMVTALLQQATAGQPMPQQLVSLQSWPSGLAQAVLQHAGTGAAVGATDAAQQRAPLPALQNWLVQQGVIQAQDGERAFTMTLRVPVAWAQAQAALGQALPAGSGALNGPAPAPGFAAPAAGLLPLPFGGSVQQLASGSMGLVMQPVVLPGSQAAINVQAMRTSAILQLEFQPLAQAAQSAQAASVYLPGHVLPQDVQAMLQTRPNDPWLLMAQAQAEGQQRPSRHAGEQAGLCNVAGCQYEGRAVCAQPFCAQMNYLWSVARMQRRS